MKKSETYTATIEDYSSDGHGVCRIEGAAAFVPGALVGEVWRIKVVKAAPSRLYARGEELLSPSPERSVPICPYYGKCGGCGLMHMSYEEELRFKLGRLNSALRHIGKLDFEATEIIGAKETTGYRNKAIFAVAPTPNGAAAGFYRKRSHELIPVNVCQIQTPLSSRVCAAVLSFMAENNIPAYDEAGGTGSVRYIFTRCALKTGQAQAVIISARGFGRQTGALVENLRSACPELRSIALLINKSRGNSVLRGDLYTLWGTEEIEDILCGLKFSLSPKSFFQINPPQAEALYERAAQYASLEGKTALDLYCGTGAISLYFALKAKFVTGVEIVEDAIINARRSALANSITNARFINAGAADAAEALLLEGASPDVVVVDPPRKGMDGEAVKAVIRLSPEKLVYISCDPATLARDLARFSSNGYKISSACAVDMFPKTPHVETVVLLSRSNLILNTD